LLCFIFPYLTVGRYGDLQVNKTDSDITLSFDDKEFHWTQNESLLTRLEDEGIVKLVFPLHDEIKRKQLLRSWALKWFDFTWQPIDEIYSYFGTKVDQRDCTCYTYHI
jgi:anoctamin-10